MTALGCLRVGERLHGRLPPVSRAAARELLGDQPPCGRIQIDFSGVEAIGPSFADEIFRVFANAHPEVELVPMHAVPGVQQMIRRAEVLRDEMGGQLSLLRPESR